MRTRTISLLLFLVACGSSASDPPTDEGQPSSGESGGSAGALGTVQGSAGSAGSVGTSGSGGTASMGGGSGHQGTAGSAGSVGSMLLDASVTTDGHVGVDGNVAKDSAVVTLPPTTCQKLAGVNVWEKVTPPAASGLGVLTVVMDPRDHTTVYATLDKKGLYKSKDCGATWTKVNTGRNAAVIDSGWEWVFVIDPVDGNVMYTSPLYGSDLRLFKSVNAGVDWDPIFAKGGNVEQAMEYIFTEIFALDTADHEHIVANFHVDCKSPYTKMCLAESYDAGATWKVLNGPPSLGGWAEDAGPVVVNGGIYLGVPFDGLFYSGDHGVSWAKVAPGGYFEMYHSTNGYYYMGAAQQTVQRSLDLKTWKALPNTPTTVSNAIIGDGHRIFAAARAFEMYTASPEADGATWSTIPAPSGAGGAKMFAYDSVNHLLYSSNQDRGLFRMVTY